MHANEGTCSGHDHAGSGFKCEKVRWELERFERPKDRDRGLWVGHSLGHSARVARSQHHRLPVPPASILVPVRAEGRVEKRLRGRNWQGPLAAVCLRPHLPTSPWGVWRLQYRLTKYSTELPATGPVLAVLETTLIFRPIPYFHRVCGPATRRR